jgi:transposase InsO family protein
MPWKETCVMDEKKKFILESFNNDQTFTELCSQFGITTKTGYKWRERFLKGGWPALINKPRSPKTTGRPIPAEVILELIRLKNKKRAWGAYKIRSLFIRNHPDIKPPVLSSIDRIFEKAGLSQKKRRRRHIPSERIQNRFKPTAPNDLWTVDFKGWWYTKNKERVNPLTIRDDFSRMILAIKVVEKGDISSVKAEFERLFKLYGLPRCIRSDNGPPFASPINALGLTRLSVWWMTLGILLDRIDPGCPYQNGSHERMHRDMKMELEGKIDGNLHEHQKVIDEWREEFNTERPHQALQGRCPVEVYKKSERKYFPDPEEIEYMRGTRVRHVNDRGYMHYAGRRYFVGNPFSGYPVGIRVNKNGEQEVWFTSFVIGTLDVEGSLIKFNLRLKIEKTP